MDGFGCIFKELDPVYSHIDSAKVVVARGMKFRGHSNEVVIIRGLRIAELDFISLVVRLWW